MYIYFSSNMRLCYSEYFHQPRKEQNDENGRLKTNKSNTYLGYGNNETKIDTTVLSTMYIPKTKLTLFGTVYRLKDKMNKNAFRNVIFSTLN